MHPLMDNVHFVLSRENHPSPEQCQVQISSKELHTWNYTTHQHCKQGLRPTRESPISALTTAAFLAVEEALWDTPFCDAFGKHLPYRELPFTPCTHQQLHTQWCQRWSTTSPLPPRWPPLLQSSKSLEVQIGSNLLKNVTTNFLSRKTRKFPNWCWRNWREWEY